MPTFFVWPKILKFLCISHLPLNKLLGLLQMTPLNFSGSTFFSPFSSTKMLLSKDPPFICYINSSTPQTSNSDFFPLSLNTSAFNAMLSILGLAPPGLRHCKVLQAAHGTTCRQSSSSWDSLKRDFPLLCLGNVWILDIRKAIIKRWVPTFFLNLTRVKLLMTQ